MYCQLMKYINNLLNFTVRVHSWILPVDHELYLLYNSSFLNVTFSTFVERLNQFIMSGYNFTRFK